MPWWGWLLVYFGYVGCGLGTAWCATNDMAKPDEDGVLFVSMLFWPILLVGWAFGSLLLHVRGRK